MNLFTLVTLLIMVAAAFAYLHTCLLKLPDAIGIMVVSLAFSLLLGLGVVQPAWSEVIRHPVATIKFDQVLFDVRLSLRLFTGAIHTDASLLNIERWFVMLFALVGVLLSTGLIGTGLYYLSLGLGLGLSFSLCLLFGPLISPIDPIAVLGILARLKLPERVKPHIVGEFLFNDGVGVAPPFIASCSAAPAASG